MATYVITGASRGIGLELTKQLLDLPSSEVSKIFALTRSDPPQQLKDLIAKSQGRVIHISAAVDNTESVQNAAKEVKAKLGSQGLDVLVNNAGLAIMTPGGVTTATPEDMAKLFDVNVLGPQRVTQAFLPLLEAGRLKKVINVSSTLGSIGWADNFRRTPSHGYNVSKSALHMLNMQYSLEFGDKGFTFLCISPGWLKTDLGGPEYADLEVEIGVKELKRIMLEADQSKNGKFFNIRVPGMEDAVGRYNGGEIPW